MGSVSLRKVGRDLWLARGRAAVMIAAICVSIVALGSALGASSVLSREMAPSFASTHPASATLVLAEPIDTHLLADVRLRAGIADAQARALVSGRVQVGGDRWLPLSLFVVEDFSDLRIETVMSVDGAWPPPTGTLLVERSSLQVVAASTGSSLTIQTPDGATLVVPVAGVVSDPALAPAWQEQRLYAYASAETLARLGAPSALDQLKISVAENRDSRDAIVGTARDLSAWLAQRGWTVEEIRVPPPGEHPHQRLMNALVSVLLLFALLLLSLSAVVVATLVSGMLSRHVRQIGAMKAVGATATQIATMYALLMFVIGAAAAILSLPLSTLAGARLASILADMSNVALASSAFPWWVYQVELLAGLLLPLLAASVPIARASSMTVREAVSEIGLYAVGAGGSRAATNRISHVVGPTLVLAARNALRSRGRLVLSVGLLAIGGAMSMAGVNVAAASDARMAAMEAARRYDIDLQLSRAQPTGSVLELVRGVPSVAYAEPLGFTMVTPVSGSEVPLAGTHKDGGHGNLALWALSPTTRYPNQLVAGRDLEPGDRDAVVVGRGSLAALETSVGESVSLAIEGTTTQWRVVGVVQGFGIGANTGVFTTQTALARALGQEGLTSGLRIESVRHDPEGRQQTMQAVERALRGADVTIAQDMQVEWVNTVLRNHIAIVQGALQFLGVLVGVVGALTLASAMSTSVVERSREFGVMQTLGAGPARILAIVVSEGVLVGALSYVWALALGTLLSYLLGGLVGTFLFDDPLPLVISPAALGAWLAVALGVSAIAGIYPATSAARMTIRETLVYA